MDTSNSHCDHISHFHWWGLHSPKAELHNYSGAINSPILPSSLAPFLSTLLPNCCFSLSLSHRKLFFLKTEYWKCCHIPAMRIPDGEQTMACIIFNILTKMVLETSYSWADLALWVKCGRWVGRLWRKAREAKFLSSNWGNKTFTPTAGGAGWVGRAQEELERTLVTYLSHHISKQDHQ